MKITEADVFTTLGLFRSSDYAPLTAQENARDNVAPLYRRALEIREQFPGVDELALAVALELNGLAATQTDGAAAAQAFFTRSAEIRRRHIQKLSPTVPLPAKPPAQQNPTPPPQDGRFRIGGGVSAPTLASKVEPEYSDLARRAKRQGQAALSAVVTQTGDPVTIRLTRSLGLGLDEQAYFAVRQWKFRPGMKEGQPVNVRTNIAVTFRLL